MRESLLFDNSALESVQRYFGVLLHHWLQTYDHQGYRWTPRRSGATPQRIWWEMSKIHWLSILSEAEHCNSSVIKLRAWKRQDKWKNTQIEIRRRIHAKLKESRGRSSIAPKIWVKAQQYAQPPARNRHKV